MENKINVEELLRAFVFEGELENVIQLHDGHINNTYRFDFRAENGSLNRYLVQELNTYVFKDHEGLMNNVMGVTAHMQKKVQNMAAIPRESAFAFFLQQTASLSILTAKAAAGDAITLFMTPIHASV